MWVFFKFPGDDARCLGQQTGIVIGIHDDVACGLVQRQIAVGRQSLSFVFVERDVGAGGEVLGDEFQIAFVRILVGDDIVYSLLRRKQYVLHANYAFV